MAGSAMARPQNFDLDLSLGGSSAVAADEPFDVSKRKILPCILTIFRTSLFQCASASGIFSMNAIFISMEKFSTTFYGL